MKRNEPLEIILKRNLLVEAAYKIHGFTVPEICVIFKMTRSNVYKVLKKE